MDNIDIKQIIKDEGPLRKFDGVTPEGFVLILEETLEELKNYDTWVEWKSNRLSIKDLNRKNFSKI